MAIENIGEIEQSLGIETGKLAEMISAEETHKVDLSGFVIKPKSDYDALITNIKKESGTAAVEIAVKSAREEMGLEFQGKTMENLLGSYKSKVEADAKIEPNQKYDTLKSDFDKRGDLIEEWEGKYKGLKTDMSRKENERVISNTLLKEIPDNISIPKEDILAIAKARNQFNIGEDGFEIIGKDGKPMKNEANMNLTTAEEFMKEFIKPYLKEVQGGGGGKDKNGKVIVAGSFEAFEKEMADKGVTPVEFNAELQKRITDGTLKM